MGQGALYRWKTEILALGPKMSLGRGPIWCFLRGWAEFKLYATVDDISLIIIIIIITRISNAR